ncbi:MAG: HEAT repeat domain-containing protein [Melioribacter sp.]|nr:HEAT repeat domain-containing protein [Melioribacter sp.]
MNKEKFIELVYLYLMDELQAHEKNELENAMMQDDELKNEFENIKETFNVFQNSKPAGADGRLLVSARQSLMRKVREVSEEKSSISQLIEKIKYYFYHNYGLALGGAVTLVVSIGIAYLMFIKTAQNTAILDKPVELNTSQENASNNKLNPEAPSNNPSSTIDKRNTSPQNFRESLINALLGGTNAGVRIRSISTISDQTKQESFKPDPQIKDALITAMKSDSNPAVRKEALMVLQHYSYDNQIRDAFLFVLSKDKNSGMRVAAINALADWNKEQRIIDEILKQALAKQAQTNNNTFVKIRAASILKEVE